MKNKYSSGWKIVVLLLLFILSLLVANSYAKSIGNFATFHSSNAFGEGVSSSSNPNRRPVVQYTQFGQASRNRVTTNDTMLTNQTIPQGLPLTVPRPFVPSIFPTNGNPHDPQVPCTTQQSWGTDNCSSDGQYFQSPGLTDSIGNAQYDSQPSVFAVTVSFGSTNPSLALSSGNWIAGGLSITSPTSDTSIDIGMNFFAYVANQNSPDMGVAWYIVAGCEWPPDCGNGNDYLDLGNAYLAISGASPSDQITLLVYYCQTQACLNNNQGHGYYVFDYKDPSVTGSSFYTALDFYPPSYQHGSMYYGIQHLPSAGYNPPYDYSYGSQVGVSSNQYPISNGNWEVEFSAPGYQFAGNTITYGPAYELTTGATSEPSDTCQYCRMGDAWWHYNWAWGGLDSYFDELTVLSATPIKDLSTSQVNGQTLTATTTTVNSGVSSGECVKVTDFSDLKSDSGSEDTWALGFWIAAHPVYNGILWNLGSTDECTTNPTTWLYASGFTVPDNTTALLGNYAQIY